MSPTTQSLNTSFARGDTKRKQRSTTSSVLKVGPTSGMAELAGPIFSTKTRVVRYFFSVGASPRPKSSNTYTRTEPDAFPGPSEEAARITLCSWLDRVDRPKYKVPNRRALTIHKPSHGHGRWTSGPNLAMRYEFLILKKTGISAMEARYREDNCKCQSFHGLSP